MLGQEHMSLEGSYVGLDRSGELGRRAHKASQMLSSCTICPRSCRVNRLRGERGFCKSGYRAKVSHFLPHFGEEPPITGQNGAGTIFFSHCNLACIYCQNHQISQEGIGGEAKKEDLSAMMLRLQEFGCHNVEFVSPTQHLPAILEALEMSIRKGLHIPLVYNTNGYESLETLAILDGIIDIYLPDFKYGDDEIAEKYSCVRDYPHRALESLQEMWRQVGELQGRDGAAAKGVIIRHLIIPSCMENTHKVLSLIAEKISTDVQLSLMSQYSPVHKACDHPEINRRLSVQEYDRCIEWTEKMGFKNVWIQELNSADDFLPDFTMHEPFTFKRT
jgi:putative pyruvate formate lyase activating enzyme